MTENKAELRRTLRVRRQQYVAHLDIMAERLAFRTAPSPLRRLLAEAEVIALYRPMGSEPDPLLLFEQLPHPLPALVLPRFDKRGDAMQFAHWAPGEALEVGPYGVEQPEGSARTLRPDLVLAPLVGFDRALRRLGQGGGHYDRAFEAFPHAQRIGIAWSVQEVDMVPCDPWDVPMHAILTEREYIERT